MAKNSGSTRSDVRRGSASISKIPMSMGDDVNIDTTYIRSLGFSSSSISRGRDSAEYGIDMDGITIRLTANRKKGTVVLQPFDDGVTLSQASKIKLLDGTSLKKTSFGLEIVRGDGKFSFTNKEISAFLKGNRKV